MIDYCLIGKRIAKYRREYRYTQEQLAEMAGISNNYLSNIEHNRSIPSLETLMKLCEALGLTPNDLLIGTSPDAAHYMDSDVMQLFESCSPNQKSFILKFIQLFTESYPVA